MYRLVIKIIVMVT
ncbi:hypothetical protein F383_29369 [Gossypium arboreum]|uniref:Uncharacterized protein n=1 Tax=Gossypium arboreum TaxID=29729 RepID=A0A0B0MPV9_GOSAR|nr:hypothetical protein F383_29369 [Gossypium arboreum]